VKAAISETLRAKELRFQIKIPWLRTQCKFVTPMGQAHSNAHKLPSVLVLEKKKHIYIGFCHALSNAYKPAKGGRPQFSY